MANISDAIEEFILSVIGDEDTLQLSRNDLASYFKVAPSQINYVLSTRFNIDKGYVIESKRGGGGSITLIRLNLNEEEVIPRVLQEVDKTPMLMYNKACDFIQYLIDNDVITEEESNIIKSAISDKALTMPYAEKIRQSIFKEILIGLMKRGR